MRRFFHWLAGIAVAIGLAIVGYQEPVLGLGLLVAGAVVWILTHSKISRWIVGPLHGRPDEENSKRNGNFTLARQRRLVGALKRYASDEANVKILFASQTHRLLAEQITGVFELAGWQTNMSSVPLESFIHHHQVRGIEVKGYNKHLVDAIVKLLTTAGLQGIESTVAQPQIAKENPKWERVQRHVRITIGHHP